MGGFPETLDKLALRLSAAADMPVSLLLGQAPAGLQATGDSDIRFFYDRIAQLQARIRPMIERLVKWVMLSTTGPTNGQEPETWCVEFPSLWQQTEAEKVATRKTQMEIDTGYIAAQVYSPEEAAAFRFSGDTYSFETSIDFAEREKLAKADAAATASLGGSSDIQKEALNGAQISSLIEVVTAVNSGAISRESGIAALKLAFQLDDAEAIALVGPETFKATAPAPASPFGGPPAAPAPEVTNAG
jgi:hypothetical protein